MESLMHALAPQLLALQQESDWDLADGWADCYSSTPPMVGALPCLISPRAAVSSDGPAGEDFSLLLPDELLEKIFSLLPISNIFRAGAVCCRWNAIAMSRRFFRSWGGKASPGPWYFMFKDFMFKEYKYNEGLVYDHGAKKWYSLSLPCIISEKMGFAASSHGLICFADCSNGYRLFLCNPMTKACKKIQEPYPRWAADYYAVAMDLDKVSRVQTIVVARSSQVPDDYSRWSLNIDVCTAVSEAWRTKATATLNGWRGGESSVICSGVFYCVIHSTAMVSGRNDEYRHGLISFDFSSSALEVGSIPMPCSLTCVKLINCNEKLVMVGSIGKADVVKGIGIWELRSEWVEISRMPNKFFRGFGEFDDVFASSGTGDLIYIHAYGSPQLLLFSLRQHTWQWSQKCPLVKKHPLHLFTGFCFEPRLDACP